MAICSVADVASPNSVKGGKKLRIALSSIEQRITRAGLLRMGFLEGNIYSDTHPTRGTKRAALPVAIVAFFNEFGTSRIPPRPFFRTTISQKSKLWGDNLAKALKHYEYNGELALRAVGQGMRDDLENSIATWSSPPNAARTIKIKGFNKPLVDDGTMQRSPDFEIATK
jgi:hypothetical protein